MTRFILIRHGETDWNIEGRWQGQADVPLNARGREQAAKLARSLSETSIAAIYSSDLSRARETAERLAQVSGLQVCIDPRLREIHQGEWQGQLFTDIQAKYADEFHQRKKHPMSMAPPGGETAFQVRERVLGAIQDIGHKHLGRTVAIVSHGFAIAVLLAHYQNVPIEQVWDLIPENGTWQEFRLAD